MYTNIVLCARESEPLGGTKGRHRARGEHKPSRGSVISEVSNHKLHQMVLLVCKALLSVKFKTCEVLVPNEN